MCGGICDYGRHGRFRTGSGIILPPDHEHTRCTPQFVMKRIAELTMRNVSVLFAGNAELASAIAFRIFIERQTKLDIVSSPQPVSRVLPIGPISPISPIKFADNPKE